MSLHIGVFSPFFPTPAAGNCAACHKPLSKYACLAHNTDNGVLHALHVKCLKQYQESVSVSEFNSFYSDEQARRAANKREYSCIQCGGSLRVSLPHSMPVEEESSDEDSDDECDLNALRALQQKSIKVQFNPAEGAQQALKDEDLVQLGIAVRADAKLKGEDRERAILLIVGQETGAEKQGSEELLVRLLGQEGGISIDIRSQALIEAVKKGQVAFINALLVGEPALSREAIEALLDFPGLHQDEELHRKVILTVSTNGRAISAEDAHAYFWVNNRVDRAIEMAEAAHLGTWGIIKGVGIALFNQFVSLVYRVLHFVEWRLRELGDYLYSLISHL